MVKMPGYRNATELVTDTYLRLWSNSKKDWCVVVPGVWGRPPVNVDITFQAAGTPDEGKWRKAACEPLPV